MRDQKNILQNIDWVLVALFVVMVLIGWVNIYTAVYNEEHSSIFDLSQSYGKQTLWIGGACILALMILVIDGKFYAGCGLSLYSHASL